MTGPPRNPLNLALAGQDIPPILIRLIDSHIAWITSRDRGQAGPPAPATDAVEREYHTSACAALIGVWFREVDR